MIAFAIYFTSQMCIAEKIMDINSRMIAFIYTELGTYKH
jgi:hypothetical protein